jgi:hypothetical protein
MFLNRIKQIEIKVMFQIIKVKGKNQKFKILFKINNFQEKILNLSIHFKMIIKANCLKKINLQY